jgi:hypothetical protein
MAIRKDFADVVRALDLGTHETVAVMDAADDCHMNPRDYCRLMVLVAAGMGGVAEHIERAIVASGEAEDLAPPRKRGAGKRKAGRK